MEMDRPPSFGHCRLCWGHRHGDISTHQVGFTVLCGVGLFRGMKNEERGDLQQAQGAQPLEGQWRDALEGVVAENPVG